MTRIVKGKKTVNKVLQMLAWSFSRWKDYTNCPAQARYKHVDKIKEPDSPSGAHGDAVHKNADKYVSGNLKTFPKELDVFKKEINDLRRRKALTEQQWAFTRDWESCDWFDMPRAWLRIKVDVHYLEVAKKPVGSRTHGFTNQTTVVIIDYKTGKVHAEEHKMQRDLYALGAMLMYPDAAAVQVAHWYADSGDKHEDDYTADQLDELKQQWLTRTVPMFRDRRFAPKPGNHCRWCFFSKSKNGPCKF